MSLTVEKCLQAWTNSLRQMNGKADIVFFGDSLTYYGDFSSVFPGKVVCNLGLRGDTIQGMINRVEQVEIINPRQVLLMAGINDVATCSCNQFFDIYEELVRKLISLIPEADIFVQSLLPVNEHDFNISCNNAQIIRCNANIRTIASKFKLPYLDLYNIYSDNFCLPTIDTIDGIHLRSEAYSKWFNYLLKIIR